MAAKTKAVVATEFVTKKDFEDAMGTILDKLTSMEDKKVNAPVSEEEKKIIEAAPNPVQTNPEWDKTAREILGEYLDHTEVAHERSGGIKFTIVIKASKSNASAEYMQMAKSDRRTKDVGASGMEGVTEWCKLVRSNLKRTEKN